MITKEHYAAIMQDLPDNWTNDKVMKSDVMFLRGDVNSEDVLKDIKINDVDTVKYSNGAVLWSVSRESQTKSGIVKLVGTKIYKKMTIRNVNTARKIAELL